MADHDQGPKFRAHCCPHCDCAGDGDGISRRSFLGGMSGAALGGMALAWASWSEVAGADDQLPQPPARKPLVVKPILTYAVPKRAPQTSWRPWGGIQTEEDAQAESARIRDELNKLQATADFPVQFLPVTVVLASTYLVPVFGVIIAMVLWHETLGTLTIVGAVVVLAATVLIMKYDASA